MGIEKLTINDISKTKRITLGDVVPIKIFRLLRLIGMHKILGESAGHTLYMVGKELGEGLDVSSIDGFLALLKDLKIGIPEVKESNDERMVIFVKECITCSGLPG